MGKKKTCKRVKTNCINIRYSSFFTWSVLFPKSHSLRIMTSQAARITFRLLVAFLAIMVLFYVGRPLYWKISATIQEIRENKRTVQQGSFSSLSTYISLCMFRFLNLCGLFALRDIADCLRSAEIGRLVSRRVRFWSSWRSESD